MIRSGADHLFNTADDVTVTPGFLGLGDTSREVVMRFAANLPDDNYHITLVGSGVKPPVVSVNPTSLAATVPEGGQQTQTLTLANLGTSRLDFVPPPSAARDLFDASGNAISGIQWFGGTLRGT